MCLARGTLLAKLTVPTFLELSVTSKHLEPQTLETAPFTALLYLKPAVLENTLYLVAL